MPKFVFFAFAVGFESDLSFQKLRFIIKNNFSEDARQSSIAEAERLKILHQKEYPAYKYKPRKKTNSNGNQHVNAEIIEIRAVARSETPEGHIVMRWV